MNDILYICLKLDDKSRSELRQLAAEIFADDYSRLLCDHLTLAYGRECELFNMGLIGEKATIVSNQIAYDDRIAALVVDRSQVEKLGVNNEHPHVTLAIFDHSTKPAYSNQLLAQDDYDVLEFPEDPITLTGEVVAIQK